MREKFWNALGTIPFTADGTVDGKITVLDVCGMHVKQKVILKSSVAPDRVDLIIKRVLSATEIVVGTAGTNINTFADMSAYLVADSATIRVDEQKKPNIPKEDREHAQHAEEPINARRVAQVDCYGDYYTDANPLPTSLPASGQDVNIRDENGDAFDASNPLSVQLTDGNINIGTVNAELEVQLSHQDNVPDAGDVHDSVRIGGLSSDEVEVSTDNELGVRDTNDNGGLDIVLAIPADAVVELRVGGSIKVNRKIVVMQALDRDLKWGFSNSTQSFDIFKDQLIIMPFGLTSIFIKNTNISVSKSIAIGEVS